MATLRLPEDTETERSLLSTICQPGAEGAAMECTTALRQEDFIHPAHRAVFHALCSLLADGSEICLTTLRDALNRAGTINHVGGLTGLVEMLGGEEVGRPMVLVEILQRHRRRRELIRLGAQLVRDAQDDGAAPETLTENAAAELFRIAMRQDRRRIRHISEVSDESLASVSDEMNGVRGNHTWVKDWPRLNGMLGGGFHPGQLIVLAARPGVGKTALALNWILGAADYRRAAGIFSLEMPAERLWRRLAAAHAGIDLRALVETRDRAAFGRLGKAKQELDKRGIWIQDRAGITAREILGEVDGLLALQPDLGLLVVDHLGLISTPETARNARQNESTRIGEITRAFKILAGDRGIPVLLLTQLNREVEKRSGGKPQLSDLRDSGCVEQDADTVMFIHRKGHEPGDRSATLDIAKHREGPIGEIPMDWDSCLTRFQEVERMTGAAQPQFDEPEEWV